MRGRPQNHWTQSHTIRIPMVSPKTCPGTTLKKQAGEKAGGFALGLLVDMESLHINILLDYCDIINIILYIYRIILAT